MMNPPESDLAPCQTCGGSGTQPIGERRSRHDPIPALPGEKGRSYLCKDSDGNWYYLNHAREWHTCPAPGASTDLRHRVRRDLESGKL